MKKNYKVLTCVVIATIMLASCGGGNETSNNGGVEALSEPMNDSNNEFDFSSAEEALNAYSEMMEEYASLLAEGNQDAAAKYLKSLESMEKYVNSTFSDQTELLKSMTDMSKGIMELQSEYLDNVMDMYDDVLDQMGDMPGASEAKEAMKDAQKEMDDAMKDAQKQMDDAMKGFGGGF